MSPLESDTVERLASKYIWWQEPREAALHPQRVIAQVMNIGDYKDVTLVASVVGEEYLRHVLTQAEAGQFNGRSWAYWHYRLGLCQPGQVPEMPRRRIE
jgi:hypothetical protein